MLPLEKRHILGGIGLIVMGVALVTFAYPYQLQEFLNVVRALQVTATVALLFGLMKKEVEHKEKFLLFWLLISAFLFTSLVYSSFDYLSHDFRTYYFSVFFLCLLVLCGEWFAAVVVAYLMYFIYHEFQELRQNNSLALSFRVPYQISNAVTETKEQPPAYIPPTSDFLSVPIHTY